MYIYVQQVMCNFFSHETNKNNIIMNIIIQIDK